MSCRYEPWVSAGWVLMGKAHLAERRPTKTKIQSSDGEKHASAERTLFPFLLSSVVLFFATAIPEPAERFNYGDLGKSSNL